MINQQSAIYSLPIKQVLNGSRNNQQDQIDNLVVYNKAIQIFQVVGILKQYSVMNNEIARQIKSEIKDDTGTLQTTNYLFDEEYPLWAQTISKDYKPNNLFQQYVKAVIEPKQYMDDIVYKCIYMELIDDPNKIILHLMDCMQTKKEIIPFKEFEYYLEKTLGAFEKCQYLNLNLVDICIKQDLSPRNVKNCLNYLVQQGILKEVDDQYSLI